MSWAIFIASMPELLVAALGTLKMTVLAFIFAAILGLVLAILRMSGSVAGRLASQNKNQPLSIHSVPHVAYLLAC